MRLTHKDVIALTLDCRRAADGTLRLKDITGLHAALGTFRYRCRRAGDDRLHPRLSRSLLRRVEHIDRRARVLVSTAAGGRGDSGRSLGSFVLLMPHRRRR